MGIARENSMKQALVLILIFVATAFGASAQSEYSSVRLARSAVEAERRAMIATNLELGDEHRDAFWPLYLEYRLAVSKITDEKVVFYERFFSSYETLSDAEALALLDELIDDIKTGRFTP